MKYVVRPEIRGLIFDLDGTLADSMPLSFRAWQNALSRYDASIDSSVLKPFLGAPGIRIAEEILRVTNLSAEVPVKEIVESKQEEYHKLQHLILPIEPVMDIVRRYHGILPMAVGTGGHRETSLKTLEIIGAKNYFDIIVSSGDVTNPKPDPETFLRCAELMGVEPAFIEVFEDGEMGFQAARSAGMTVTDVRSWYDSDW